MAEQKITEIMETTMEKIKTMVDADTIIGEKIEVDGVTIIPISKMSFGFASGASDIGNESKVFAGGGGAGATITPVGFLSVKDGEVKMVPITPVFAPAAAAIEALPQAFEKIKTLFKKENNSEKDNNIK